ncbi:hypothetical protein [Coxiella endosymbiont of Ornithodoros maritimus]|uniref:hypothetical protein n=1 Tax=Coxiella endosymbiont of Ornithodoros maritimus TaxID=1656172 RepID=UPI002B3FFFDB|nr:hypothetical protein [Coxiella endosymbiont of Ornithodoros maritimus]
MIKRIEKATLNSGLGELKIAEFIEITPSSISDENIHYLSREFKARGPYQKSKAKTSAESFNNEQIIKFPLNYNNNFMKAIQPLYITNPLSTSIN